MYNFGIKFYDCLQVFVELDVKIFEKQKLLFSAQLPTEKTDSGTKCQQTESQRNGKPAGQKASEKNPKTTLLHLFFLFFSINCFSPAFVSDGF